MRFALRNKDKLIDSFGVKYYNLLIESLKSHFESHAEIEEVGIEGSVHTFIFVHNVQPKTDTDFQFVVIKKTFDCYLLAYYSAMS